MKKLLLLGNLGWMLVLTLVLTKCNDTKPDTSPSLTNCNDVKGVTGMNASFFLKGLARYRAFQLSASNDKLRPLTNPNFEDSRSCWYSIDTLKKFMCLIERYAQMDPDFDPATSDLGIRFYYATYPDTEQQTMLLKTGPNFLSKVINVSVGLHHTLFMVPTHHDKESDLDLDVFQPMTLRGSEIVAPDKKINPATLYHPDWQAMMKSASTPLLILGKTVSTPSSKNQGYLCPPCGGIDAATTLSKADQLFPDDPSLTH
jgi:hypothetical protein